MGARHCIGEFDFHNPVRLLFLQEEGLFNTYTYEHPGLLAAMGVGFCSFADDVKLYDSVIDMQSHDGLQEAVDIVPGMGPSRGIPMSNNRTTFLRSGTSRFETAVTFLMGLGLIMFIFSANNTFRLTFDKDCEMTIRNPLC